MALPTKHRVLQMQPHVQQRTPLQSLSSPRVNIAPRCTVDVPVSNDHLPTATAVPVCIETGLGVVTPNDCAQASIDGYVGDDESDDLIGSPTTTTNLCEDCCARPPEYGLRGESSPRFCRVCADLHRHANRPDVVQMPPIPEAGPWTR